MSWVPGNIIIGPRQTAWLGPWEEALANMTGSTGLVNMASSQPTWFSPTSLTASVTTLPGGHGTTTGTVGTNNLLGYYVLATGDAPRILQDTTQDTCVEYVWDTTRILLVPTHDKYQPIWDILPGY